MRITAITDKEKLGNTTKCEWGNLPESYGESDIYQMTVS